MTIQDRRKLPRSQEHRRRIAVANQEYQQRKREEEELTLQEEVERLAVRAENEARKLRAAAEALKGLAPDRKRGPMSEEQKRKISAGVRRNARRRAERSN